MDVIGFLNKAVEKCGFIRERYDDLSIPTDISRISVVPFFGDLRSLFVLSVLLLNRFRVEEKSSKYFIVCSWPGFEGLFPYADEFWAIKDEELYDTMYFDTNLFCNKNDKISKLYRDLNSYFFEDVIIPSEEFSSVYDDGITDGFWKRYKNIQRTFPVIPSSVSLGKYFGRDLANKGGFKVFIYPSIYMQNYKLGKVNNFKANKDFWILLIKQLINAGIVPVIYKGPFTYDLSSDFLEDCIHLKERNISKVLAAMRTVGCVLDIFSGISRFAIMARCPFVSVDERARYFKYKDYEIDDLCAINLPRKYIFTFSNIIESGDIKSWEGSLIDIITNKLNEFLPELDRDNWPAPHGGTDIVSYDLVRKKKLNKMGTKLFKIPRS